MEIFLRHLADTGFHNGVSKTLGLHRSTVGKAFDFFLEKVIRKAESWIYFFLNMAEINKAKESWVNRFKIAGVTH